MRTNATDFLSATDLYQQKLGQTIAAAQITNGGPIVLVQPENEYSYPYGDIVFPNHEYFAYVESQLRNAGIVVPFIDNDAGPQGLFAPGNGTGSVDIYGHDSYPLGFDCANPYVWPDNNLPMTFRTLHEEQSPTTPYSIVEFQGGSFDPWGGSGFAKCLTLVNEQYERVFYKNDFSFLVTIINYYMTYGGTNWGNLGHPGGYTSYDYGAVIAEDQTVAREKYSEAKLLANSLHASPAYLTATPGNASNGSYVDTSAIAVTPLFGNGSATNFYVVRHAAYNSNASTDYKLSVDTSMGNVTIPQLNGASLTLNGRDSKIHVTDFDVGGTNLIYSSGEVFTWQKDGSRTTLLLFGGEGETHELALPSSVGMCSTTSAPVSQISDGQPQAAATGSSIQQKMSGSANVVQWDVMPSEQTLYCQSADLMIYLLWRNDVYNWWRLELPGPDPVGNYTSMNKSSVLVSGGYLMRSATLSGSSLYLTGDLNATTTISVVAGACSATDLYFNGQQLDAQKSNNSLTATISYLPPAITLPSLGSLSWSSIDTLPELSSTYSDASWTPANQANSNNPLALSTPNSLYASDYGFNTGSLIYRGHFTSTSDSQNTTLSLLTQGGYAYGYSVYLNSTPIHLYPGISTAENNTVSISLPSLTPSTPYVLTIITDHMGLDENFNPGLDSMKNPRGVLSYNLSSYPQHAITWSLTGNLGGESYIDKSRGPLNEGAFFAERMGYHLPGAPVSGQGWDSSSPYEGFSGSGARFYTAEFELDLPTPQYAVPLGFQFSNTTSSGGETAEYRAVLFVNGFQFGKYVNNVGPQEVFAVPEGILDYQGVNKVGVVLWSFEMGSVKLGGLELVQTGTAVMTGRGTVEVVQADVWSERTGAY